MGIYEELKARGLIAQVTDEEQIRDLVNNGKATFYIGFDCTADSLHVGHFMALCLMKRLQMAGNKPIALIVDEAQHALTSEEGEAAMSALKAARDTMNTNGEINLMLVMSGSDRDKLLRLVNTNGAPFYGSEIRKMPLLGKDFVDHVKSQLDAAYPDCPLLLDVDGEPALHEALARALQAAGIGYAIA